MDDEGLCRNSKATQPGWLWPYRERLCWDSLVSKCRPTSRRPVQHRPRTLTRRTRTCYISGMILDRFRLDGQVAVVTGAGRGIGAGSARRAGRGRRRRRALLAHRVPAHGGRRARSRRSAAARSWCPPTCPTWTRSPASPSGRTTSWAGSTSWSTTSAAPSPTSFLDTTPDYLEEAFRWNVSTAHALSRAAVPLMLEHGRRTGGPAASSTSPR